MLHNRLDVYCLLRLNQQLCGGSLAPVYTDFTAIALELYMVQQTSALPQRLSQQIYEEVSRPSVGASSSVPPDQVPWLPDCLMSCDAVCECKHVLKNVVYPSVVDCKKLTGDADPTRSYVIPSWASEAKSYSPPNEQEFRQQLRFHQDVERCIQQTLKDAAPRCLKCGKKGRAAPDMHSSCFKYRSRCPNLLALHFPTFSSKTFVNQHLSLGAIEDLRVQGVRYKLCAIVYFTGSHFVCELLIDGQWWFYDDKNGHFLLRRDCHGLHPTFQGHLHVTEFDKFAGHVLQELHEHITAMFYVKW
jgi:hypothetical protein